MNYKKDFLNFVKRHKRLIVILVILAGLTYWTFQMGWIVPRRTITVTGKARNTPKNEVATFNMTITSSNVDKLTAMESANEKVDALITAAKEFGIPSEDMRTTDINVYQWEDYSEIYYDSGDIMMSPANTTRNLTGEGEWRVTISIEVKIRDMAKATEFTSVVFSKNVDEFYGPYFSTESYTWNDAELLDAALDDAHKKAEVIATAMGKRIKKVINIIEDDNNYYPLDDDIRYMNTMENNPEYENDMAYEESMMYEDDMIMPPFPREGNMMYKTVTVVYEVR